MTASLLFALAHGRQQAIGPEHCFLCACECDQSNTTLSFIKDTFTGRDTVACPHSQFICEGCKLSFSELTDITVGNEHRTKQRIRSYSWIIRTHSYRAYTKAHLNILRDVCLNPPADCFVIVLADSGQKHLIYRAPVNFNYQSELSQVSLQLETEKITYSPPELRERIELVEKLTLICGKPGLKEKMEYNKAGLIYAHYGNVNHLDSFVKVQHEPLTRLAVWLARSKKELDNGNPKTDAGTVPAKTGGVAKRNSNPDLFSGINDQSYRYTDVRGYGRSVQRGLRPIDTLE